MNRLDKSMLLKYVESQESLAAIANEFRYIGALNKSHRILKRQVAEIVDRAAGPVIVESEDGILYIAQKLVKKKLMPLQGVDVWQGVSAASLKTTEQASWSPTTLADAVCDSIERRVVSTVSDVKVGICDTGNVRATEMPAASVQTVRDFIAVSTKLRAEKQKRHTATQAKTEEAKQLKTAAENIVRRVGAVRLTDSKGRTVQFWGDEITVVGKPNLKFVKQMLTEKLTDIQTRHQKLTVNDGLQILKKQVTFETTEADFRNSAPQRTQEKFVLDYIVY